MNELGCCLRLKAAKPITSKPDNIIPLLFPLLFLPHILHEGVETDEVHSLDSQEVQEIICVSKSSEGVKNRFHSRSATCTNR